MIYFPPSWPKKVLNFFSKGLKFQPLTSNYAAPKPSYHKTATIIIIIYMVLHLSIPLRHHFYPGYVQWGDKGYYFACLMMGRSKESGSVKFIATDPDSDKSWEINPGKYLVLNLKQRQTILTRPHSILRLSHFFAKKLKEEGYENIEIRADIKTTLNGRKLQNIVDPNFDLAKVKTSFFSSKWITKLENPLPPRQENISHLALEKKRMKNK